MIKKCSVVTCLTYHLKRLPTEGEILTFVCPLTFGKVWGEKGRAPTVWACRLVFPSSEEENERQLHVC